MNTFSTDLGELVMASLENRKPVLTGVRPELIRLLGIASKHHMNTLLLTPALNNWDWKAEEAARIRERVMSSMYFTAVLNATQKEIENTFEEKGVKFLFMKGTVLKDLFPRKELREMGDIDLLVYPESFADAEKALLEIGYKIEEDVKQHEIFRSQRGVCVEVHHTMCDRTTDKKMYDYFCDYSRHKLKEGKKYTYVLSDEDFYIYMMAHSARHFYIKGCGIRNLVDIYVFNKVLGDKVDRSYIEAELDKIGILDYTRQMEKTVAIWLGKEEGSQLFDNIFEYMLEGGSYGHDYNGIWNRFAKQRLSDENKRKLKKWFYFPPLAYMAEKYPVLEEHPGLLPFYWVKRVFDTIFTSKKQRKLKEERRELVQSVDEETIRRMSEIYQSMNFNFSSR